jgi:hypothetical protein
MSNESNFDLFLSDVVPTLIEPQKYFSFFMDPQVGLGLLTVELSRYTQTHHTR